jgi:DHA2 family methylenomycin A resistance protein-like MFS transporter
LVAICFGFFMVILDTSVVNVALPAIQRDLHGSLSGLQWVVNGYTLVFASSARGHWGIDLGISAHFCWGMCSLRVPHCSVVLLPRSLF